MSDVKRYTPTVGACGVDIHRIDHVLRVDGEFVRFEDYDALRAQLQRQCKLNDDAAEEIDRLRQRIAEDETAIGAIAIALLEAKDELALVVQRAENAEAALAAAEARVTGLEIVFDDLSEITKRTEARLAAADAALMDSRACFDAADADGWNGALLMGDIERIRDIYSRRIAFARQTIDAAMEGGK